ncbi:MAG TPA: adenylate kinase [Candidatus Limnocylindrales bacterium]|nr:adenylate kinase [Candidatus Limnocylindrales bacterium]
MRVVLLGPPGSGKGTHGRRLSEALGVPLIATGDILREAIAQGTRLGMAAQEDVKAGRLVSDSTVLGIIETRLLQKDAANGFVLDGFPRTTAQADGLAALLGDRKVDRAVNLVVPPEMVVERLKNRLVCSNCGEIYNVASRPPRQPGVCDVCGGEVKQRPDDRPETVRARLEVYERETAPLVIYYERLGTLRNVNAAGPPEAVYAAIQQAVGKVAA